MEQSIIIYIIDLDDFFFLYSLEVSLRMEKSMFYFSSTGMVASKAQSAKSVDSRYIGYALQPSVMRTLNNP